MRQRRRTRTPLGLIVKVCAIHAVILLLTTVSPNGGEWGLVAPAVFKTVVSARKRRKVGSIPTRLRQTYAERNSDRISGRRVSPPAAARERRVLQHSLRAGDAAALRAARE